MSAAHRAVLAEIHEATATLVESGLADDQNAAYESRTGQQTFVVRYSNMLPFAPLLKNVPYVDLYCEQRDNRSFNVLMLDGAVIQMVYEFSADQLTRHRLAFLPSPNLLDYQNFPELYEEEVLYADVVDKRAVTVPLRFDYDARAGVAVELRHPVSHLTLGQYSGCRVPVTAGVTPHAFIDFVLRSFYSTAYAHSVAAFPAPRHRFADCITDRERSVIHVGLPSRL